MAILCLGMLGGEELTAPGRPGKLGGRALWMREPVSLWCGYRIRLSCGRSWGLMREPKLNERLRLRSEGGPAVEVQFFQELKGLRWVGVG